MPLYCPHFPQTPDLPVPIWEDRHFDGVPGGEEGLFLRLDAAIVDRLDAQPDLAVVGQELDHLLRELANDRVPTEDPFGVLEELRRYPKPVLGFLHHNFLVDSPH